MDVCAGWLRAGRDLLSHPRVPLFGGFLGLALLLLAMGAMWYREGR